MSDFVNLLFGTEMPFLRYALLSALVSCVAFGIVGTVVVVRRISSLAGAIAHAVLGGVGAAIYAQRVLNWQWCLPIYGAIVSAVLAAVIIGAAKYYAKEREDTVIGVVWALGMALGLVFIAKTPGYVDLQGYLFGNILLQSRADFYTTLVLDALILIPAIVFYHTIVAVSFDECFASLRGIPTKWVNFLILILVALTIVLMVNVVGIILVIALLTLPAASANQAVKQVGPMMALAALFSLLYTAGGIGVSYWGDWPCGGAIVIVAALGYACMLAIGKIKHLRG